MTIRDILDAGVMIQGCIIIYEYDEASDNKVDLFDEEVNDYLYVGGELTGDIADREIKYIYAEDAVTYIEVE